MQAANNQELKQIKIDNWGSYFLQRLLQLYFNEEFFDLDLKFEGSDNILRVHKLVISTCTNYLSQLEKEQIEQDSSKEHKVIILPPDMPYECVKSIVSFIYTGQLNYWTSEQNNLYLAAKKMNIPVLIRLLEAQTNSAESKNSSEIPSEPPNEDFKDLNSSMPSGNPPEKKIFTSKRKVLENINSCGDSRPESNNTVMSQKFSNHTVNGPSRFDLPGIEDLALGVFSSFEDITYNTRPIIQANEDKSADKTFNMHGHDENQFTEDTEFVKKDKLYSDTLINDWEESETSSHCDEISNSERKKFYFNSDRKEMFKEPRNEQSDFSIDDSNIVNNHTKIVREVLKKYPYLMKQSKNIKLKILKKESKSTESSMAGKRKISYVVLKSDALLNDDANKHGKFDNISSDNEIRSNDLGPWKCTKCDLNEEYLDYHTYRIHMQNVHGEKFDPRICEYCGFKTSKRNTLMYHMYTKHDIPPPKNLSFPKCQECSYIALSKSFLIKHQINHKHHSSNSSTHNLNVNSSGNVMYKKKLVSMASNQNQILQVYSGDSISNNKNEIFSDDVDPLSISHNSQSQNSTDEKLLQTSVELEPSMSPHSESANETIFYVKEDGKLLNCKKEKLDKSYYETNQDIDNERVISISNDEKHNSSLKDEYSIYINKESNGDTVIRLQNDTNFDDKANKSNDENTIETTQINKELSNEQGIVPKNENFESETFDTEEMICDPENELYKEEQSSEAMEEEITQYVEEETEIIECETYNEY